MFQRQIFFRLFACLLVGWGLVSAARGQEDVPAEVSPSPAGGTGEDLHILQQALLNDYQRFDDKLLELAEYIRRTDPDRAQLLVNARSRSTALRISAQMKRIAEALTPTSTGDVLYGDAEARQEDLLVDLAALLKLLQSEDQRDRLAEEIARLEELRKETERLIAHQKDVRADTERGGEFGKLQGDQQRVAEQAKTLADKIDRQDAERQAEQEQSRSEQERDAESSDAEQDGEQQDGEQDPKGGSRESDAEPSDKNQQGEPAEQGGEQSSDPQPSDGQQQQSPGRQPQQGQPQQGQPQQGQPQQGQPQQGQQQQSQQTPGRPQLEEARREMEQAIEQLKQEQRDAASDEQDAVIARLEEMKAELEEILRQLREEERKLFLAMLEARFQRMLEVQLEINNDTLKLDRIPEEERDVDRHLAESTGLSRKEAGNVDEAEKALMLLKEEGSSVAFPEAVEMMRDNMQAVVGRLQRGLTEDTTQLLERLIVEALEEMIFALQREMEKQDQQQQDGESQQGEPTDPMLVDALAELKMVRSLQMQVNRLTQQYGAELEGEQATDPEDREFLQNLSRRQLRIEEATYDLSIGKNR